MASVMAWRPEPEPLKQLAGYLKDALSPHDKNAQKYAELVCLRRSRQRLNPRRRSFRLANIHL